MKHDWKKRYGILLLIVTTFLILSGCFGKENTYGLTPKDPQEIMIWHYYNGAQAVEFEKAVEKFNNGVGLEKGIIVSAQSKSSIEDLTKALVDSANKVVGADKMPDIFQCYLDTAVNLDELDILVDLDKYITEEEKEEYVASYIQEGIFGKDDKWKLFPVAKGSELLALNKTDWDKFQSATGADMNKLSTWEGITELSEQYFKWSGGKSFFGRDAFANYMIVGSKQLGHEIFQVKNGKVELNIDKATMKKLWDNFYVPYVKGYFKHMGRYRSDDVKIGEIISCVCSTSAVSYFPQEVTIGEEDPYTIESLMLPVPGFEGQDSYAVQQGASMAVTKSNERAEYASTVFLKWFTEEENNIKYSIETGYLPVKKQANKWENIEKVLKENKMKVFDIQKENLKIAVEQADSYKLYTTKGFMGGEDARKVLETSMIDLAKENRESILEGIKKGKSEAEALKPYLSEAVFENWLEDMKSQLETICQ